MGFQKWTPERRRNRYIVYGDGTRYEIWRETLKIYTKKGWSHHKLPSFFLNILEPNEEEIALFELEFGIDFPPMKIYNALMNSKQRPIGEPPR